MCQKKPCWAILHLQTWLMDRASGSSVPSGPPTPEADTRIRNSLKGQVNQWSQCKLNLWIVHKSISGFPGDSGGEESVWCGRPRFDPWVGTIPWRREWPPTLILLPGEFCGQRSLADYNPWGHKESDTTEQLTLSLLRVNSQFNRAQSLKVNLGIQEQHPGSILSIRKSRGKGV